MKQVVILGTTPYSVAMYRMVKIEQAFEVLAFSTKKEFIKETCLDGIPVVAQEDLDDTFDMTQVKLLMTIGYGHMNTVREKVYNEVVSKYGETILESFVSKRANVYCDIPKNSGVIIMPGAYLGPEIKIGKCCVIRANTTITHHITLEDFSFIGAGVVIGGNTVVGHHSFVGLNSTIKNKIVLPPYSLVGCGSNVIKNYISDYPVIVGNPAVVLNGKQSLDSL